MGEPMMDYDDLKDKDFCPTDSCPCYDKMWSEIERLREEVKTLNTALDMATADVNKAHDRNERLAKDYDTAREAHDDLIMENDKLREEVKVWQNHTKTAVWSDSEECKFLSAEVERLKEKCDKQAMILRRFSPENYPDTFFIAGFIGEKDQNGLPKYIEVCPAYGVDWTHIYERTDRTIGGMGS